MPSANFGTQTVYGSVTVGTTAVQLAPSRMRKSALIQNVHVENNLFIAGDANVTAANGIRLAAGESREYDDYGGPIFGIADAVGTDVRVEEVI